MRKRAGASKYHSGRRRYNFEDDYDDDCCCDDVEDCECCNCDGQRVIFPTVLLCGFVFICLAFWIGNFHPIIPIQPEEIPESSLRASLEIPIGHKKCENMLTLLYLRGEHLWHRYTTYGDDVGKTRLEGDHYPQSAIKEMIDFGKLRHTPYALLNESCVNELIYKKFVEGPREMNIIIAGSIDRFYNIYYTLQSIDIAARKAKKTNIHVVLAEYLRVDLHVEQGLIKLVGHKWTHIKVSYLGIPEYIGRIWGCDHMFPTSLVYNIAYLLLPKSDWYMTLVSDFVLPNNFFKELDFEANDYPDAFYPYVDCLYLKPAETRHMIATFKRKGIFPQKYKGRRRYNDTTGAYGGAIILSHKKWKEVGGYTTEFFCGWSAEDLEMRNKLMQFNGGHLYRLNIRALHMHHVKQKGYGKHNALGDYIATIHDWDIGHFNFTSLLEFYKIQRDKFTMDADALEKWSKVDKVYGESILQEIKKVK